MLNQVRLIELSEILSLPPTLPPALRCAIVDQSSEVRLGGGQAVFEPGQSCSTFVAVTSGRIRVSKLAPDGRELLLYYVGPGEFCVVTVSCILGRRPYPAHGTTAEPITGIALPADLFRQLVAEVPACREAAFRSMASRLTDVMSLVEEIAFYRLDERLAHLLLRRTESGRTDLAVTHHGLAEDLGSTREVVSRVLESLQLRGVIELSRKRIVILDRDGLAGIAVSSSNR